MQDADFDLNWILDRTVDAVRRDGARILLIDPWNEIEHRRGKNESLSEYIGWAIRQLKQFAMLHNIIVIVVAHPTKMQKRRNHKDGDAAPYETPSLYDVSDSAHWYNKCDHGVIVARNFDPPNTDIIVAKSRFDEAGAGGVVRMLYDTITHRFDVLAEARDH